MNHICVQRVVCSFKSFLVKRIASFQWSSSLYCLPWNSGPMTIENAPHFTRQNLECNFCWLRINIYLLCREATINKLVHLSLNSLLQLRAKFQVQFFQQPQNSLKMLLSLNLINNAALQMMIIKRQNLHLLDPKIQKI